jgi:hypothetical protein
MTSDAVALASTVTLGAAAGGDAADPVALAAGASVTVTVTVPVMNGCRVHRYGNVPGVSKRTT